MARPWEMAGYLRVNRAIVASTEVEDVHVGMKRYGFYRLPQHERTITYGRASWTEYGCI